MDACALLVTLGAVFHQQCPVCGHLPQPSGLPPRYSHGHDYRHSDTMRVMILYQPSCHVLPPEDKQNEPSLVLSDYRDREMVTRKQAMIHSRCTSETYHKMKLISSVSYCLSGSKSRSHKS